MLAGAGWDAVLDPEDGAGLRALRHGGQDILLPVPDGARLGGPGGAFWMIPWANRLDGGRLGGFGSLPVNRPEDDTAIHGLSRDRAWQVLDARPGAARLRQAVAAGPYQYGARLSVALGRQGFTMDLALTNTGEAPMPFGAGWHPWFRRPSGSRLDFAARGRCVHDARCLPVALEPATGLSGGEAAWLGLDTHFAGWDGVARLGWPGVALRLEASGALATNLQVYAPWGQAVLCVEPSSHLPDAVNRAALGAAAGPMTMLGPGATLRGRVRLSLEG